LGHLYAPSNFCGDLNSREIVWTREAQMPDGCCSGQWKENFIALVLSALDSTKKAQSESNRLVLRFGIPKF